MDVQSAWLAASVRVMSYPKLAGMENLDAPIGDWGKNASAC